MLKQDFLFELGTEELPCQTQQSITSILGKLITEQFTEAKLSFEHCRVFVTPRRIAVLVHQLDSEQADSTAQRKGPTLKAAFDQTGAPTQAALGFAKSCGTSVDKLVINDTNKGAWLTFEFTKKGNLTETLLPELIENAVKMLPIAKPMRWGEGNAKFIRPVHWLVVLFGEKIIDCTVLEKTASNFTFGHRFHANKPLEIKAPKDYESVLEQQGFCIPCFEKRKQKIHRLILDVEKEINSTAVVDDALLNEVTALTEWPVALAGKFDEKFLAIPKEVLISSMKNHQKYFHTIGTNNSLTPFFITISNIKSKDPQVIISGNEKVVRPRLEDASFFYQEDIKTSLQQKRDQKLTNIIFQNKLGSIYDKTERIRTLAEFITEQIGGNVANATRAGTLCKSDLASLMVFEFPELQGTMGYYYAKNEGLDNDVCEAIQQHYCPKFSGDTLPTLKESCAVAIADKIDTIVGIFGVNQLPSGTKDPFALRRSALGILRIIVEKQLDLELNTLIEKSIDAYKNTNVLFKVENLNQKVIHFILERFKTYYHDHNISTDIFQSVLALNVLKPYDFDLRVRAVNQFSNMDESASLASANKRVSNIISKSGKLSIPNKIDVQLFEKKEEHNLYNEITKKTEKIKPLVQNKEYTLIMKQLTDLKKTVDAFFDAVLVNDERMNIRLNRYVLLHHLRLLFLNVADISLLQKKQ